MPQQIEIEGLGLLEFPDDATDQEILEFANSQIQGRQQESFTPLTPFSETPQWDPRDITAPGFDPAIPLSAGSDVGGTGLPVAGEPNVIEELQRPTLEYHTFKPEDLKFLNRYMPDWVGRGAGALTAVENAANSLTSPQNIALLGLAGLPAAAQKVAAGIFMALLAKTEGEQAGELYAELQLPKDQQDQAKIGQLFTDVSLINPGFGLVLGGVIGAKGPKGEPIRVQDQGALIADMEARFQQVTGDQRAMEAGSPFVREPTTGNIPLAEQFQPFQTAKPTLEMALGEADSPFGTRMRPAGEPAPEVSPLPEAQPPIPLGPPPGTRSAAKKLLTMAEEEARVADFEAARAERVAQEQAAGEAATAHPDKPLTENQVRIIADSLRKSLTEGQIEEMLSGPINPEVLDRMLVSGVKLMAKGVVSLADWATSMKGEFGPIPAASLRELHERVSALRTSQFEQPKGEPSASTIPSAAGVPQPEIRTPVGEGTSLRQQGEAAAAPPGETPRTGEAAGEASDALKMRKFSERGTVAEMVPPVVQEKIKAAPESYYEPQNVQDVVREVKAMDDATLAAVPKDSNIKTAAVTELMERMFDRGQNDAGYNIFENWSSELTRMGQVVNQAKLLTSLRPESVVTVVNETLKRGKRDPLTPEQANRVRNVADTRIRAQRELDKATGKWVREPTDANAAAAEKLLDESNSAAVAEQTLVNQFKPRSPFQVLKSVLQGNLLTPISETANLVGNVSFLPFRAQVRTGAAALDMLDSYMRGRPRQASVSPIRGTIEAGKGFIEGVKQIPSVLARGTGETVKGETRAGLHPARAWAKQLGMNPDVPTVGGKIPLSERLSLAIEGTAGVPAEAMLRGLGAGDLPFRGAARGRLINEAADLRGLPREKLRMAQKFPELFFDKKTMERINSETAKAIFQGESGTLNHITSWLKSKGNLADLAISGVAPYKLTPWNIIGEIFSYDPFVSTAKTISEATKGNARGAEMNAAKFFVGGALAYSGLWLYKNGLIAPSMDQSNEQQKARVLAGEVLPPNHINLSGIKRKMTGGDPSFKAGDKTVDVFRAGGLAGSTWYLMANSGRSGELKPEGNSDLIDFLKNSVLERARFGLNQSFLKGTASILDAVQEGNVDKAITDYASAMTSIPLPNTLSTISRATREYKVDMSEDALQKRVANVVKTRLGFMGTDDALPLKRGLWGEPLPETPKDANALVYHFFDISKGHQVTDDAVPLELYKLWRKTGDSKVIPTPPDKTLTVANQTYPLTTAQVSKLSELIGRQRREIVDYLVLNPEWHASDDEVKMKLLEDAYKKGAGYGKALFWEEFGDRLTPKPSKAGFQQPTE